MDIIVLTVLIVLLFILLFLLINLNVWHLLKHSRNIPGRKAYPIVGNFLDFYRNVSNMRDILVLMKDYMNTFDEFGIAKLWFGPLLLVTVWDLDMVEAALTVNNKRHIFNLIFGEIADGIFIADGEKWKEYRKPFWKSMSKKEVENNYHLTFVNKAKILVQLIKEKKIGIEFDISNYVSNTFIDIAAETHWGVHTCETVDERFNYSHNFEKYFCLSTAAKLKYHYLFWKIGTRFSGTFKVIENYKTRMNQFIDWVIDERRRGQKENNDEDKYYLDSVLKREYVKRIPREIFRKDLCDLITVSSDTSSSTLNAALVFLAMFPDIQEKAYQEQMSILGDSSRDPTTEDVAAMEYLHMVVKETLRHVAPPATFRTFDRDISVGKYVIPKGAICYIFFYKIHHNPKFWERVDEFYPEHFLPENEATRPYRAFIPFGSGMRSCPGSVYGVNSIMVILSTIIRTFKLSTSLKFKDIIYDYQLLLHIFNGYNVKFEERKTPLSHLPKDSVQSF